MEAAAQQAEVLAGASRDVADTSSRAAASLTDLQSAIAEISQSTARVTAVAEEAVRDAAAADARITALQETSAAISRMVAMITGISQQSRILGLNAIVEAARAGEVGRGFAVVAHEVKELAARTGAAAEEIGAQIAAVQQETREAVGSIHRISATLTSIAEAQDAIAAAVDQQRAASEGVVESVQRAASGSARITEAVAQLADAQRLVYVRRALALTRGLVDEAGGAELGERRLSLTVRNQATSQTHPAQVPELLLGGVAMERVEDPRRRAPLVDEVAAQVGGTCTVFQRLDEAGAMVRVATNVVTDAGKRNIGTYIAPVDADGGANPVLAAVLAGGTYTGPATVAGRSFYTGYTGLHSAAGELIGMLYVGLPLPTAT